MKNETFISSFWSVNEKNDFCYSILKPLLLIKSVALSPGFFNEFDITNTSGDFSFVHNYKHLTMTLSKVFFLKLFPSITSKSIPLIFLESGFSGLIWYKWTFS